MFKVVACSVDFLFIISWLLTSACSKSALTGEDLEPDSDDDSDYDSDD